EASAALLADPVLAGDVLGAVASLLTVADGAQEAVTAALGGAADAVAVAGLDAAVTIMRQLKAADAGSAELVIAGDDARQATADRTWERAAAGLAAAMAGEERAQQAVAGALALTQEADAAAAAVSGQLGRLAGAARAAQDEATRLAAAIAAAREKSGWDQAALTELSARLAAEEAGEASPRPEPAGDAGAD